MLLQYFFFFTNNSCIQTNECTFCILPINDVHFANEVLLFQLVLGEGTSTRCSLGVGILLAQDDEAIKQKHVTLRPLFGSHLFGQHTIWNSSTSWIRLSTYSLSFSHTHSLCTHALMHTHTFSISLCVLVPQDTKTFHHPQSHTYTHSITNPLHQTHTHTHIFSLCVLVP